MDKFTIQERKELLKLVALEMTQRMERIYKVWNEILEFLQELDPEKVRELDRKHAGEVRLWREFIGLERPSES